MSDDAIAETIRLAVPLFRRRVTRGIDLCCALRPAGTGFEPSLKGFRAFARHFACQNVLHTHILVQIRPVNSFALADQPVVGALIREPCNNRGYQASGTETVRPSAKSTTKLSSVNRTAVALLAALLIAKVVMPFLQEYHLLL